MNKGYTLSPEIDNLPERDKIVSVLEELMNSGDLLKRLNGNCIASTDIIQHMLTFNGVNAKILECQVFLVDSPANTPNKNFSFIGVNQMGKVNGNEVDTHVVIVTETNPPVLIDASISGYLPDSDSILVRVAEHDFVEKPIIAKYEIGNMSITYRTKNKIKLPDLHQKNLLDRFKESQMVNTKITFLQKIVIGIATLSVINFTLNVIMIILKLMNP